MTRHTIVEAMNPSRRVHRTHAIRLMLVAPETGVLLVIAVAVARSAARTMVLVKNKEFAVVKCRGFPKVLAMTLGAGESLRAMKPILGRTVTCSTLMTYTFGQ